MINKLEELLKIKYEKKMKLAVVASQDHEVLEAVSEGANLNIIEPILIGDINKTKKIAQKYNISINKWKTIDEPDLKKSAEIGVKLVSQGNANFIMKGLVDTPTLMKEVLNKDYGLRTENLLSHTMIYETKNYYKFILLTDGGMNLIPNVDEKEKIINNAVKVGHALGMKKIKVACLAAKEKVDKKMIATLDAGELKKRYEEGKFEDGVIVDGPMALDLAVSKKAAQIKNYNSEVAGDADVFLVPNIEMGNGIGKSITYFADGKSAGVIMGAKVPVVLVSRADSHESKLYSIALGSLVSQHMTK
ncbi:MULTISPECIES: bifunctional enoyl-CoA hydratase/phosphate acetyltransferase [Tissierellales]|jgi:phosphate butyryltransferase|uniref:Bifunctional enoyl-CoA hydratase/phosphate acetyltransferase n=1 Tax=Acidilutibacter cellobiosedens TaxID=2507161 RepID=A0A410QBI2_9FIRM|nr:MULTISPECIES: bifunctional enoyl-CoA hydratase/phosphate acetyltransferase [Tissierellales]MBE6083353.1 bifunctional enoyl-CoA hydratase/phosphate acetyltransferase [Tissierellaceae bacterium]QAT61356.1 bifunctional enoyl-CoA hydratase/phosphate acetyltransferase [Acidilutibacter cellobiosedens]SCL94896.1 Phosphate acetyltransferase [Sporanaerobacter sp. PP17-6a]